MHGSTATLLLALPERLQALGQGSTFVELSTEALAAFPIPATTFPIRRRSPNSSTGRPPASTL